MDASFSEAFLVDNDELDLLGSDVEGSSGYGSESDGCASLSDFPMVSTDDLTRPTKECNVMKEQSSNKKSGTSITSTTNLVIPVVKYDADVFRSLIEFVHCGTVKIEMKTVAGLLCAADQFELDDLRRACWNFVEYCLESGKSGRLEKMARPYNYHEAGQRLISRIYRHYNMEDVRKLKYGQKKETTV
ncbi:hypothetical protein ScPMuIL_016500 [Solemya velum]